MIRFDYMQSSKQDKEKWMESFKITTGLKYFGGKSQIGKYLMNRICNMAVQMELDGLEEIKQDIIDGTHTKGMSRTYPDIFIDAFAGGGKIGLSIPDGWFDTIVINDINYGVYSYFKTCKEEPEALLKAIEFLGKVMNKDIYNFIAFNRANDGIDSERSNLREAERLVEIYNSMNQFETEKEQRAYIKTIALIDFLKDMGKLEEKLINSFKIVYEDKLEDALKEYSEEYNELLTKFNDIIENNAKQLSRKAKIAAANIDMITNERVDPVMAGAMTYWVTQLEFLGITDPYEVSYTGEKEDRKKFSATNIGEQERIERAIKYAYKQIPKISKVLNSKDIIIENLDYKELIKKYNGLSYKDLAGEPHEADESLGKQTKLWYFDPPYHPATLYAGEAAPYEDKFTWGASEEMVKILTNQLKDEYGELKYFIKSDYDPKDCYEQFSEAFEVAKRRLDRIFEEHSNLKRGKILEMYNSLFGEEDCYGEVNLGISEKEKDIEKTIKSTLNYAKRMKMQREYAKLAYHSFDSLEENCDCIDIENSTEENIVIKKPKKKSDEIVFYKELLGEFEKGVQDEGGEGTLKGKEYIWCRGDYINEETEAQSEAAEA